MVEQFIITTSEIQRAPKHNPTEIWVAIDILHAILIPLFIMNNQMKHNGDDR